MLARLFAVGLIAMTVIWLGCTSPAENAQRLYDQGKYEEIVAKYSNDPSMATMVGMAKEKLAEDLVKQGKYQLVIETYPDTKAATEAKNQLAQQLYNEGNYDELLAKYSDSPAAMKARLEMEKKKADSLANVTEKQGSQIGQQQQTIEEAARKEWNRIQQIANPRLKEQAIHEFIDSPKYKGTKAQAEARAAHQH